ncbi:flagellar protein FlgN [Cohnella hongkongensis]|uniref:Flagellar protein FlgN n=1 Tax=Cohnella hongkongensis TaxID=178337 RepID=A0ABV9FHT3_9BACL
MAFQPFMDSLQQMSALYARLIELGLRKKEQVIGNQINELTQTLSQESKVVKSLASADEARRQALVAFQQSAGLRGDPYMRLDGVVRLCTTLADKQALQTMASELSERVRTLQELNESNQQLVRQALDIVNHSLDLLVGSPEDEMVYQNPGHGAPQAKRNSYFDTRA